MMFYLNVGQMLVVRWQKAGDAGSSPEPSLFAACLSLPCQQKAAKVKKEKRHVCHCVASFSCYNLSKLLGAASVL